MDDAAVRRVVAECPSRRGTGGTGRTGLRRITVQGWILLVLSCMGILVVLGTVIGSHFLTRTTELSGPPRHYLCDRRHM